MLFSIIIILNILGDKRRPLVIQFLLATFGFSKCSHIRAQCNITYSEARMR